MSRNLEFKLCFLTFAPTHVWNSTQARGVALYARFWNKPSPFTEPGVGGTAATAIVVAKMCCGGKLRSLEGGMEI